MFLSHKKSVLENALAPPKVKEEEHLEMYGGLREEIGMRTYSHGPMDYTKTLKSDFE